MSVLMLGMVPAPAPAVQAQARARQFLEAFALDPVAAKQFVGKDATVIAGDIGGPYADFAKIIRKHGAWMKTCRIASISQVQAPSAEDLKDGPPRYRGAMLSVFEGRYSCVGPDGGKSDPKFNLVLKDNKVLELALGEGPQ